LSSAGYLAVHGEGDQDEVAKEENDFEFLINDFHYIMSFIFLHPLHSGTIKYKST
jgi:hypothetical protein